MQAIKLGKWNQLTRTEWLVVADAMEGSRTYGDGDAAPKHETLDLIAEEVLRARTKFPGNEHLLAALTEEVGELAQAMLQAKPRGEQVKEAVQVACVAVRIIEEGDASFIGWKDETP